MKSLEEIKKQLQLGRFELTRHALIPNHLDRATDGIFTL